MPIDDAASRPQYPRSASEVATILGRIYQLQGQSEIASLFTSGVPRVEFVEYQDFSRGERFDFCLILEVPLDSFAKVEPRMSEVNDDIASKLFNTFPVQNDCLLVTVRISPSLEASEKRTKQELEDAAAHIWTQGYFRLFLSHLSRDQAQVHKLKAELTHFGISAFVAHVDVEPTSIWQTEIELGLHSMHSLVALVTPDFHASAWCNQEVGFALGRSIHTISFRLGEDPKGFLGKYQAAPASLENASSMAADIFILLTKNSTTASHIRDGLSSALKKASSFTEAEGFMTKISLLDGWSSQQVIELKQIREQNSQVRDNPHIYLLSGIIG